MKGTPASTLCLLVASAVVVAACDPTEAAHSGEVRKRAASSGAKPPSEAPSPSEPADHPERAVEIVLPSPARWVEASRGRRIAPARYVAHYNQPRHCGAVWFEEERHVRWVEGDDTRVVEEPLATAWGRARAYHDYPLGLGSVCHLTPDHDLRCRIYDCLTAADEGRVDRRRCAAEWPLGRTSNVQRTWRFLPTRHWRRSDRGGRTFTCLRADGRVRCFPLVGNRPRQVSTPELAAWSNVQDLSAGGSQACAILEDATVWCWGMPYIPDIAQDRSNEEEVFEAMLEYSGSPWTPRQIEGLPPVVQVSVGLRLACARTEDGRVFCWGAPKCLRPPRFSPRQGGSATLAD